MAEEKAPATIQFDETVKRSGTQQIYESDQIGGVYSRRRRGSKVSFHSRNDEVYLESKGVADEDEDSGLRNDADYKKKQQFSFKAVALLAYQSVGVIYGDIGTSPLYVYSSTFSDSPSRDDLMGALSLIIWSLFMMVTVKYVFVIIRADNEGEGGTFSTYALLSRYANISNRDPREASLVRMQRYHSGELGNAGQGVRNTMEKSRFIRGLLKTIGVLAVSMIISDGLLTPAQSVLGAVQGLNVVVPNITNATVVGTSCGILVLLFMLQPLGVGRISSAFAPIIIIWLLWNACFGIYNLAHYDYTILKAFNPYYAFDYLIRNGEEGWRSLGGILLAFTGVEALFADVGAFSQRAVQLSWLCFTFPCLLLAYSGQAAYISVYPDAYSNPFYNAAPSGWVIPSLIIGILAAIVASQAIITATFQLLAQVMKLSYFPQIKVVHTSTSHHGQVYIPLANWLLMIGTVIVAAVYNNTTSLGNAYGVCVMFVTFFDTCMVTLTAIIVWRINPFWVFLPWLTVAAMDGTFLSSVLTKVPDGAWFTITLSGILACVFILWRFGKEQQWFAEAEDRYPTSHFVKSIQSTTPGESAVLTLSEKYGSTPLSRIAGMGIFFDKAGETTPIVFSQFIRKLTGLPEVTIFFHLRSLEKPTVGLEDRYHVSRLAIPNCYRLIVRHGYMDEVITPDLAALIYQKVRDHIVRRAVRDPRSPDAIAPGTPTPTTTAQETSSSNTDPSSEKQAAATDSQTQAELAALDRAFAHESLYIIGKEQMRVKAQTNFIRKVLLELFLFLRENTRGKIASIKVQMERVIEVGFVKDV